MIKAPYRIYLYAALGIVVLSGAITTPAQAQIDELVVTAQKRAESLQDVPIAVSAFESDFLQDIGFEDIFDLENYTPGLYFTQSQSATQTTIILRGIGTSGNNAGFEPSVGIFIDGVYRSRTGAGIFDMPDLERVEVLRGPQSTLFGRNTIAGTINIITKKPEYEFGGSAEVSYGNYDYINTRATVTGPLGDKAALRVTGIFTDRDGYIHNLHLDTKLNDRNRWSLKGQLLLNPTDTFEARLIVDYSEMDEVCCGGVAFVNGPTDAALAAVPLFGGLGLSSGNIPTILSGDDFFDRDVAINDDPISKAEDFGVSLEINWDIGNVTLTSITAYRTYDFFGAIDADFTNLDIVPLNSRDFDQSAITQEIRIQNNDADRFEWLAGFYFFSQDLDMDEQLRFGADTDAYIELIFPAVVEALGGLPSGSVALAGGPGSVASLGLFADGTGVNDFHKQDHRSWALFAQGTYDVTEKLSLTGGIRFTKERKDLASTFTEIPPGGTGFLPGGLGAFIPVTIFGVPNIPLAPPPVPPGTVPLGFASFQPTTPVADFDIRLNDSEVTGTAKIQYQWTPDIQTYASYSRGYKSGGTNVARVVSGNFLFKPEKVDSYEIGLKGQFFDDRLRVNLAGYIAKYNDFQDTTFIGTGFLVQNAGKVESKGIEFEATAVPTDWLTLQSMVTWQDSEFKKFESGPCQAFEVSTGLLPGSCDRSGDRTPQTPDWTAHFAATVEQPITDMVTGFVRGDLTYRSDFITATTNDPRSLDDGYTTIGARVGLVVDDGRFEISVWGKNLTDAEWIPLSFDGVLQTGKLYAYPNEPRTYGVTVRASF
ncbi:MAG: TonB-dependent receptor [Alphaproteobacteria bacterium]|nr:MAG: TonB-dependent receptor [Alphaproteobacteria bacterium]